MTYKLQIQVERFKSPVQFALKNAISTEAPEEYKQGKNGRIFKGDNQVQEPAQDKSQQSSEIKISYI